MQQKVVVTVRQSSDCVLSWLCVIMHVDEKVKEDVFEDWWVVEHAAQVV